MLKNIRTTRLALASAAVIAGASGALAEVHDIQILNGAYFPPTTYAMPGDTIVFINSSFAEHKVVGDDKEWSSDKIPVDGTFSLVLEEDTPSTFEGKAHDDTMMSGNIVLVKTN